MTNNVNEKKKKDFQGINLCNIFYFRVVRMPFQL
jgi:hypothetical protein